MPPPNALSRARIATQSGRDSPTFARCSEKNHRFLLVQPAMRKWARKDKLIAGSPQPLLRGVVASSLQLESQEQSVMDETTRRKKACAIYGGATLACCGLTFFLLQLWRADLRIPFVYGGGDELPICLWIKGLRDNPWIFYNSRVG